MTDNPSVCQTQHTLESRLTQTRGEPRVKRWEGPGINRPPLNTLADSSEQVDIKIRKKKLTLVFFGNVRVIWEGWPYPGKVSHVEVSACRKEGRHETRAIQRRADHQHPERG